VATRARDTADVVEDVNVALGSKLTYPSGGSDGDVLVKDGTDADWVAPEPPGLELITSETFSTVSAVSLDGCFSATYQNYRVVITNLIPSTAGELLMRVRAGGTDLSTGTAYNAVGFETLIPSTFTGFFVSAQNNFFVSKMNNSSNNVGACVIDFTQPFQLAHTNLFAQVMGRSSGNQPFGGNWNGTVYDNTTAFDGLTLYVGSGTVSGTVRVYGYKD
jgi:hypothetical protein